MEREIVSPVFLHQKRKCPLEAPSQDVLRVQSHLEQGVMTQPNGSTYSQHLKWIKTRTNWTSRMATSLARIIAMCNWASTFCQTIYEFFKNANTSQHYYREALQMSMMRPREVMKLAPNSKLIKNRFGIGTQWVAPWGRDAHPARKCDMSAGRQGWERNKSQWGRGIITKNGRGNILCRTHKIPATTVQSLPQKNMRPAKDGNSLVDMEGKPSKNPGCSGGEGHSSEPTVSSGLHEQFSQPWAMQEKRISYWKHRWL